MPQLKLNFLGSFRVTVGDEPVTGFAADKVRALLAYLAVEGKSAHRREALAGLLWPNYPESDALTSLRQALRRLRQALGLTATEATQVAQDIPSQLLLVTPQTTQLEPGGYYLDVDEFTELAQTCQSHRHRKLAHCSTCHARLHRAADLYRGDFLAGFLPEDSEPFDEWLVLTRERLRRQALEVFAHLAQYYEARSDYKQTIQYAYRQIEMEPWREDVHRQVMLLLATTGQRNAAIAQYESCKRMLSQELAIEPEAETVALYERIKSGLDEPGTINAGIQGDAGARNSIPPPVAVFVGRERELRSIAERLDSAECRLVTLVGPGGVGKTRLAIQAASEQVGAFDDGVWFVQLVTANTPLLMVSSIAQAIGLSFEASAEPQETQLLNYLRDREMLLLLDNFEQLLDSGISLLIDILNHAPRIVMLVTSRERLGLQAEHLFDLEGLSLPTIGADLTESGAVRLFVERAKQVRSQFTLSPDNAQGVLDICRLVDGLPLAIVLAAAWVRHFSTARIAASISENLDFLATSSRDGTPRHSSLRAVFNHSWDLLSEDERRVFRKLSVFRGGWDEETAEEVAGASLSLLLSLVDKSFLRSASERYDMHEVLRRYAAEQLNLVPEERSATLARHAACFLALAEQAEEQLRGSDQSSWLERLDREHDNIRAVLRRTWEVGQMTRADQTGQALEARRTEEIGLRIAGAIWRFWWVRGHLSEGREQLEELLEQPTGNSALDAPTLPSAARAKALNGAGVLAYLQGDYGAARDLYEESLVIRRELGDKQGIASSLNNLGLVADYQGDYAAARSLLEESLAMMRELGVGDKWTIASSLNNLGAVAHSQGDYAAARALLEESLVIRRELGDKQGIALSLNDLGNTSYSQGDYAAACDLYEESLVIRRELGDKQGIASSLNNLGAVAYRQGNYAAARALYAEGLVMMRELGVKGGIAGCLVGLGSVAAGMHQAGRGIRLLGAADELLKGVGAVLHPEEIVLYEQGISSARSQLDEAEVEKGWAEGRAMTLDQIMSLVVDLR